MMELNNPSINNIYDSTYWNKVIKEEQSLSNDLYDKAKNPLDTGVVSRYDTSSTLIKNCTLKPGQAISSCLLFAQKPSFK